jgi:hypothetical protein
VGVHVCGAFHHVPHWSGRAGLRRKLFETILNLCSEVWQASCVLAGCLMDISVRGAVSELIEITDQMDPFKLYGAYARAFTNSISNSVLDHPPFARLLSDNIQKADCYDALRLDPNELQNLRSTLTLFRRLAASVTHLYRPHLGTDDRPVTFPVRMR